MLSATQNPSTKLGLQHLGSCPRHVGTTVKDLGTNKSNETSLKDYPFFHMSFERRDNLP